MKFLSGLLLVASTAFLTTSAETCNNGHVHHAVMPFKTNVTYTACEADSKYSLLALSPPTTDQATAMCKSSSCQSLLRMFLDDNILPHCQVTIRGFTLSLVDAVTAVGAKCLA